MAKNNKDNDLDIKIATAWVAFRNSLESVMNNSDAYAELAFESSLNRTTHYTFEVEEVVYVSDFKFNEGGFLYFSSPYGSKEKCFMYKDSDLIAVTNSTKNETRRSLMQIVDDLYVEAFKDIEEAKTIRQLEKILAKEPDFIKILNDAEFHLSELKKKTERTSQYEKIEDFGIF